MKVGEQAFDFTRCDQTGKEITLSELPRPILMVFLGIWSIDFAKAQFRKRLPVLLQAHEKGANVVCVSNNYIDVNAEIAREFNILFPLLDDSSNTDAMMLYQQNSSQNERVTFYPIYLIDKNFAVSYMSKEGETLDDMLGLVPSPNPPTSAL